MKPKVLVTKLLAEDTLRYLQEHAEVKMLDHRQGVTRERLLQEAADAQGLLTSGFAINEELLNAAPQLRVVSNMSVGYNNFDLEIMRSRGVIGTNTPDVLSETVADTIFGLMLGTARRIPELHHYVRQGKWQKGDDEKLFGMDVHGTVLGIIGLGSIGETVARRAALGFGMKVQYYNRKPRELNHQALGYELQYTPMGELLQTSDFVLLMTPLTESTYHLLGSEQFQQMKRTAFFINASRGATVDEPALIEALQKGWIKGAGLDVFEQEPVDPGNPLLQMDNVVVLPHIGSATAQTRNAMAKLAAKNLVCALTGLEPPNVVKELKG